MGKSQSAKMQVTEYRLSIHMGVAWGPVDEVQALYLGEKVMWTGSVTGLDPTAIDINNPDLFGGRKKEGGPVGRAWILPGGPDQVLPSELCTRLGRTTVTCPGFRGLLSIFFIGTTTLTTGYFGGQTYGGAGFHWTTNSPYIQPVWVKAKRAPKGIAAGYAMIGQDANPACMIYECMSSTDFGMGTPDTLIDIPSFEAAALQLYTENFGLTMIWVKSAKIEDYISEILDHIQATLFLDPTTGKFVLKLIRDDYDASGLLIISPDNAVLTNYARKMWGETANEISVTWTNPDNEQEESVSYQDLANVVIQGAPVTDSRNYYGVRNADLAMRLAVRDTRTVSAPLVLAEAMVDRTIWNKKPGDVVKLNWPDKGANNLVMRVGDIKYGKKGSPHVKVSLMEDVFSLAHPATDVPPDSGWINTSENPTAMAYSQVITLPRYFIDGGTGFDSSSLVYPEVVAGVLAAQTGLDTASYDLYAQQMAANGVLAYINQGTRSILGRALAGAEIAQSAVSTFVGNPLAAQGRGPESGGFIIIGAGGDPDCEIGVIRTVTGTGAATEWVVDRGVLDTIPRYWPSGTPIWFLAPNVLIADSNNIRSMGETVNYKLLPRTSLGVLPIASAPTLSGTLSARPHMPLRPANFKVNGTAFGSRNISSGANSTITLTWANRNRLLEPQQVTKWTDAGVEPEYLQRTVISIYRSDGTLYWRHEWLYTEETFAFPRTWLLGMTKVFVQVGSVRQGIESLQSYGLWLTNIPAGTPTTPTDYTEPTEPDPPAPEPDPTPNYPNVPFTDPFDPPPMPGDGPIVW